MEYGRKDEAKKSRENQSKEYQLQRLTNNLKYSKNLDSSSAIISTGYRKLSQRFILAKLHFFISLRLFFITSNCHN